MPLKPGAILRSAVFLFGLALAMPLVAQDESVASRVDRAFELLGLEGELTDDPERIAEGLPLLQQAATEGEGVAQNALGMAYANGLFGLEMDIDRAIALYEQAMDSEIVGNIATLNWALINYAEGNLEPAIARLEELYSLDWELASAAAAPLAEAYAFGTGVEQDLSYAGRLYEVAIEFDPYDSQAHYMLGRGYEAGFFDGGVQTERALSHYRTAAELGDPRAAWKVGMAHLQAEPGFDGGSSEAYLWVRRSAEEGWEQGMISTAVMLATGDGTDKNVEEAAYWYTEAALLGSPHAMRGLGAMHYFGELADSEPALGLALLELGAEGGDESAVAILEAIQADIGAIDRQAVERHKQDWR